MPIYILRKDVLPQQKKRERKRERKVKVKVKKKGPPTAPKGRRWRNRLLGGWQNEFLAFVVCSVVFRLTIVEVDLDVGRASIIAVNSLDGFGFAIIHG